MNTILYITGIYLLAPVGCFIYGATSYITRQAYLKTKKSIGELGRCKCGVCRQFKDPIHK